MTIGIFEERLTKLEERLTELEDRPQPSFRPRRRFRRTRHIPRSSEPRSTLRELVDVYKEFLVDLHKPEPEPAKMPLPSRNADPRIDSPVDCEAAKMSNAARDLIKNGEISKRFLGDLTQLLNTHCLENSSNTPDFILAEYLCECLRQFNATMRKRERWYGR